MHQNSLGVPSAPETTNWSGVVGDACMGARTPCSRRAPCSTPNHAHRPAAAYRASFNIRQSYSAIISVVLFFRFCPAAQLSTCTPTGGGSCSACPCPNRPRLHGVIHGRVRAAGGGHGRWIGSVLHVLSGMRTQTAIGQGRPTHPRRSPLV
jgi:hypothetical protein